MRSDLLGGAYVENVVAERQAAVCEEQWLNVPKQAAIHSGKGGRLSRQGYDRPCQGCDGSQTFFVLYLAWLRGYLMESADIAATPPV